jgi:hypothetical protein
MFVLEVIMIIIDDEFRSLIPKLSDKEYHQLEENILTDGCRDPLVVWPVDGNEDKEYVLIDGHNRYEICDRHGIAFETIQYEFADRDSVKLWIIQNQFGRRNISYFDRARLALKYKEIIDRQNTNKQNKKNIWISAARRNFAPGLNKPCFVCNKYESVTQAHHIYPLHRQFDDGLTYPNQDFVWLCPTHNAAVHLIIDKYKRSSTHWDKYPDLTGFDPEETDKIIKLCAKFLEVAYANKY